MTVRPRGFLRDLFSDIGAVAVAMLLIVGATLSWVAYDEYGQIQEAEYRLLEAHARNAEAQVLQALGKMERLLNRIAVGSQDILKREKANSLLRRFREDLPDGGALLTTDAEGCIVGATDTAWLGHDVSGQTWFAAHRENATPRMFLSRPGPNLPGRKSVVLSVPVQGGEGQFLGTVGIVFDHRFFAGILRMINPADSASMTVIYNREGDILFRRDDPEKFFGFNMVKISTVYWPHRNAGQPTTRLIGPSAINGQSRMFVVRDAGDSGLILILSRQLDEVLAPWRNNVAINALIFVVIAAIALTLAIVATRRKREVLAGKAFADQLIETANVMVVGLDAEGRIAIFNEAAERISGYLRNEVLGRFWLDTIVSATATGDVAKLFEDFRRDGVLPHTAEYPILTKGGQERVIAWQNSVIPDPRAAISFGIDVTERNRIESDLAAAKQRAEEANLAKSKFLAAVSHDLRQPIHAQGLFLGALARTELSAHQREVLAGASAASRASFDMLNALLDFSRIEAGVVEPRVRAFHLQPLLNKIEREFGPLAEAKGIEYRARETDVAVDSDPMLVELILRNLVSNAIRYTPQGGVLVACRRRGEEVVLEVWDTGIGIAPENQQAVFREFLQLANPERDRQNGLGLGLAIVDGLARRLGHPLALASRPQRGSVFRLSLPLATEVPAEVSRSGHTWLPGFDASVLLIEDDQIVRDGMLCVLRDWGCECRGAESAEEALALARERMPDLVVSDFRLRGTRNGLAAISALRELAGHDVPALLITGDTAPDRLREAAAGGIPLLHKPVTPGRLYRALMALREREDVATD